MENALTTIANRCGPKDADEQWAKGWNILRPVISWGRATIPARVTWRDVRHVVRLNVDYAKSENQCQSQAERQRDWETDRQTDGRTDRQAGLAAIKWATAADKPPKIVWVTMRAESPMGLSLWLL